MLITGLGILVLLYFVYSDLGIRHNTQAFYTRLLPLTIVVFLFIFQILTKKKFKYLKIKLYNIFFASTVVMMYGKCLVHLHEDALASSVTGTVLVIFIISLEIKTNTLNTILIYFLPLLAFLFSLNFIYKPSTEEIIIMGNIYPIIIAGFVINRIQYKLRYKLFKSKYLLDLEKQKTEKLYEETLIINEDLHNKSEEVITHKKEIEEKNKKLQESNATKDKFFTIIAHDLRSPFNAILGLSQLLVDNFNKFDISEQRKYIIHIHQSINKTYKLLENLLIWAHTQSETIEFNPKKENLFLLTEEIIELLRQYADKKSINILNQTNKNINVDADKNMLATILRNLISNAIKFTPQEGKITLKASLISGEKDYVKISIEDTGVGISSEIKSRLFKLSENISTKGTEDETGTGLGLILCKEFIEKHGGEIWIESELGKGSNFIFTLPVISAYQ